MKLLPIALVIILAILIIPNKAHAYSVNNVGICSFQNAGASSCGLLLKITGSGDLIAMGIELSNGADSGNAQTTVTGVSDNQSNIWTLAKQNQLNFGATCFNGNCLDNEIWYTQTHTIGHDSITATFLDVISGNTGNMEAVDASGIIINVKSSTGSICNGCSQFTMTTSPNSLSFNPVADFPFGSIFTSCQASGGGIGLDAGSGYIGVSPNSIYNGAIEYGLPSAPPTTPTNFLWICNAMSGGIQSHLLMLLIQV